MQRVLAASTLILIGTVAARRPAWRWMNTCSSIAMLGLLLAGCTAVKTARLYNVEDASTMTASFKYNGSGKGLVFIGDPQAPDCRGEYVTVAGGDTSWGTVFVAGGAATGVATSTESEQRGSAVMTCSDGRAFTCEYVTSAVNGGGYGSCKDNQQHAYRLMF